MAFLNDLDAFAWAATILALVVGCLLTFANFQDWRDHQKIEIDDDRLVFIIVLGTAFIVGAFSSYSPNANAPRKTVEGIARFVAEVRGRNSYHKYICATSCQLRVAMHWISATMPQTLSTLDRATSSPTSKNLWAVLSPEFHSG